MALEDIAGYSLRRKLGSGSAGTVWLVRDRASGRNAVLKRVPMTAISHPEELHEHLTVLQDLDHPHLARLQEIRETGTEWLLFSQYVVAGTLTALLSRRGPLTRRRSPAGRSLTGRYGRSGCGVRSNSSVRFPRPPAEGVCGG